MDLEDRINEDFKKAMKEKDTIKISTLRMLKADIKNVTIEKKRELKDNELLQIISKQIKQHKESIEGFKKGNRQDLVEKEKAELEILQDYMPEQLSEDEIKQIIEKAIKETGAEEVKDLGRVMKQVMAEIAGRAEGKLVSQIVREKLSKNEPKDREEKTS